MGRLGARAKQVWNWKVTARSAVAAAVVLSAVTTPLSANGAPSSARSTAVNCDLAGRLCNDLYVGAHQDDDLLFMSPNLQRSISDKRHNVRMIYLTAGDAGDLATTQRWDLREHGARDAYAAMDGQPNTWTEATPARGIHQYTLTGDPRISLVFFRLPEGAPKVLWEDGTSSDIFGDVSYTRADLIRALASEYQRFQATRINTMDSSNTPWIYASHSDHVHTGLFALAANADYTNVDHSFVIYRDYNTSLAPPNVWGSALSKKVDTFINHYATWDPNITDNAADPGPADYVAWPQRQYSFRSVQAGTRAIVGAGGLCLTGVDTAGSTLSLGDCGSNPQRWSITASGQVKSASGLCLYGEQDMDISLVPCADVAGRNSLLMTNGQLRMNEAACADAGDNAGSAVYVAECNDSNTQRWWPQIQAAKQRSNSTDFSDATVASQTSTDKSPSVWDSLGLADVNGDGYADACMRRSDGVWCSLNDKTGKFAAATQWTTQFSNAAGWDDVSYGRTLQFGDVNRDGRADLCGRAAAGVECAIANSAGTAFQPSSSWTSSFGDDGTLESSPGYYLTFAIVDVNGDGFADACSRVPEGVACAVNNRLGQMKSAVLITTEFSDANGWSDPSYGSTLQFGDLNGDGRADMCGRGPSSLVCATITAAGTDLTSQSDATPIPETDDGEFTSTLGAAPASYRSIRIVDLNGDGYGDVCGLDPAGLKCVYSRPNDYGFFLKTVRPLAQTFSAGFQTNESRGTSLRFADINNDGHADACWRTATGLVCATN